MNAGAHPTGLVDVTVSYGGEPALRGVTLLAQPGEVLAVVGPSGGGKTTALRAVAGLQPVQRGRVLVAGRDVTSVPVAQRDVSMVFRSTTLVPFLDVAANLTRSAGAFGVPEQEAAQRVASRSKLLGLVRLLPRLPRTLSAGEAGLSGIGRTLVRTPRAFLFDEPLAHLDAAERSRTRRTIVEAVRRAGVGALYVTHDQAEAMAVGDRLAVLHQGRIRQVDHPRRVYDAPVDVFVAEFVGGAGMGMLPARLVASGAGAGFQVGERTIPLWGPVPAALAAHVGTPVLLGLRAEDVTEAGPDADPASVALPVAVRSVERPGRDTVVKAEVGLAGEADGTRLVARIAGGTSLRAGSRTELLVDARRAHVFDPETGRALLHPGRTPSGEDPRDPGRVSPRPVRIASLLPSATEIVAALGRADDLVAVTYECDPAIRERAAVVVRTALPPALQPAAIDAVVRDRAARGLPMYELDRPALAALEPDVVLTQDLCAVCALPAATVSDALAAIGGRVDVLTLDPHSVEEVLGTIRAVGDRIGAPAGDLVAGLRTRLAAVEAAVAGRARPRVLVLEWTDPPFLAGHWVPELVRRAGGEPVGGVAGGRSVAAGWAEVAGLSADVVLVAPCGYGLAAAAEQAVAVRGRFPDADVLAVDADSYVVRAGPRLVDGIEAIAWALHPDAVPTPPPGRITRCAPAR